MDGLSQRARKILSAVIEEYLATGEAVGSRTVSRRHVVDLSAATVRNVMSDLEELGLLKQPHTSAGRVPTDLGLRFFVDSLLRVRALTPREQEDLRARYESSATEVDGALRDAGRVLADLSQQTVVLLTPRRSQEVLDHLEFVRLGSGQLLAVLVTRGGRVQNRLLPPDVAVSTDDLERIHAFLAPRINGLPLAEARERILGELASERTEYDRLARRALELSRAAMPAEETAQVIIEGQAHLLERSITEAVDAVRLKQLLRALEEKQRIVSLLEQTEQAQGLQVFIGAEAKLGELTDLSLVAASYNGPDDRPIGTLGVIGPTRMDYSRVISLVDFTAQTLSRLIRGR